MPLARPRFAARIDLAEHTPKLGGAASALWGAAEAAGYQPVLLDQTPERDP